jgi:hypothetical protein
VPRLSEFYGIVVYMYFSDHHPPHIHALYGDDEALVRIADGVVIRGGLPRTATRLVQEWVTLRRPELEANWQRAQVPDSLLPVAPLR